MEDRDRVERVIAATLETKAEEVLVFDMENRSSITDYVLICSGRSQAHVRGIADRIEQNLKEAGIRSRSIEGYQEGSWVLMDYDILLVHIFHPETRAYYDLESLLAEFPSQSIAPGPPDAPDTPPPLPGNATSVA